MDDNVGVDVGAGVDVGVRGLGISLGVCPGLVVASPRSTSLDS